MYRGYNKKIMAIVCAADLISFLNMELNIQIKYINKFFI